MVRIRLSKEHLLINGIGVADEHAMAAPLTAFIEILGQHSRVTKGGVSEFFTWDDLGLCVFRDLYSRATTALTIYLGRREHGRSFHPRDSFTGELELDGRRLEKVWGAARLEAAGFTSDPDNRHHWSGGLGSYDLTVETDRKVREVFNVDIGLSSAIGGFGSTR